MTGSVEGLRVLLFGADKTSREWIKKSLIRNGVLVSTVDSHKNVLRLLRKTRMDVLLVDCHSDLTDVSRLLSAIRRTAPRVGSDIPAVVFTDASSPGSAVGDLSACGFYVHVQRPSSVDQLLRVVQQVAGPRAKRMSQRD